MNKTDEVQELITHLSKLDSKVDEFMLSIIEFVSGFEYFGYSKSQQKQLLEVCCINRIKNFVIEEETGIGNFKPVIVYEEKVV